MESNTKQKTETTETVVLSEKTAEAIKANAVRAVTKAKDANAVTPLRGALDVDSLARDTVAIQLIYEAMQAYFEVPLRDSVTVALNVRTVRTGCAGWQKFDLKAARELNEEGYSTDEARKSWADGGRNFFKVGNKLRHEVAINMHDFAPGKGEKFELSVLTEIAHVMAHHANASRGRKDMSGGGRHNQKFTDQVAQLGLLAEIAEGTTKPELTLKLNDKTAEDSRPILADFAATLPKGWADDIRHRVNTAEIKVKAPAKRVTWSCDEDAEDGKHEDGSPVVNPQTAAGQTLNATCNACGNKFAKVSN